MKNKSILIISAIIILLCGGIMIACNSKAKGSDYVGTWSREGSTVDKLIITQESDTTYSIQRTATRENIVGELKDGVIQGQLAGYDFLYNLQDGVITETTPEKTYQYTKADS